MVNRGINDGAATASGDKAKTVEKSSIASATKKLFTFYFLLGQ